MANFLAGGPHFHDFGLDERPQLNDTTPVSQRRVARCPTPCGSQRVGLRFRYGREREGEAFEHPHPCKNRKDVAPSG
jgi:hypothetical protein